MRLYRLCNGIYASSTALISFLFGCMFLLYPFCADDIWYVAYSKGTPGSSEYFISTVRNCLDHWQWDTGRLSNMASAPFLALLPRWGFALVASLATWVIFLTGRSIACAPGISFRAALWILGVSFIVPWFDFLFTIVFASNYIFAAALGLTCLWLYYRDYSHKDSPKLMDLAGLFLLGSLTGWWHEGLSVPMACGIAASLIVERRLPSRRQTAIILGLVTGIVIIMCMPAFRAMTAIRESNLLKSVWIESLVNIVAFDCMFYAYAVIFSVCMLIRKTRIRLLSDSRRFGFLIFALTFGVIATIVYLRYYNGPRTGLFAQLICMLGILRLLTARSEVATPVSRSVPVAFTLCVLVCVGNLIAAICIQSRLTREYNQVHSRYIEAKRAGRNHIFYNRTPIRIGIDLMKPSYLALNTKYSLGQIEVIPAELEGLTVSDPRMHRCRDPRLLIYRDHIICTKPMPERRVDIILYSGDRSTRSRLRHMNFTDANNDSCALIVPHLQLVGGINGLTDAEFADW